MEWLTEDMVLDGIDAIYNPKKTRRLRRGEAGLIQRLLPSLRKGIPPTSTPLTRGNKVGGVQ